MSERIETVPSDRAIWQSDTAKTYRCPTCKRMVFTQYEGNVIPAIDCRPSEHVVKWQE